MSYVGRMRNFWRAHTWEIVTATLMLLVALLSYGLGFLSARDAVRTPIIIETRTSQ